MKAVMQSVATISSPAKRHLKWRFAGGPMVARFNLLNGRFYVQAHVCFFSVQFKELYRRYIWEY